MTLRTYDVALTYSVTVTIDDEVVDPEWGLDAVAMTQHPEWVNAYYEITPERAVAMLAAIVGVDGRSVANVDGWASLHRDAVQAHTHGWDIEHVGLVNQEPSPAAGPSCPECVQGKHPNCTGDAMDEDDRFVACGCAKRGHRG